jgi:hypothetical protein
MSSPAEVVRAVLIKQGIVVYGGSVVQMPGDGTTQCFVNRFVSDPPQVLMIQDSEGIGHGSEMKTLRKLKHSRVKLNMRSLDHDAGYDTIKSVYDFFDKKLPNYTIDSRGDRHYVASIRNDSEIIFIGEEDKTRILTWSLNLRIAMWIEETELEGTA